MCPCRLLLNTWIQADASLSVLQPLVSDEDDRSLPACLRTWRLVCCRLLHNIHHKYNKEHTLSPFAGLAFHPLDGIIQVRLQG